MNFCGCGCVGVTKGGRFLPGHNLKINKLILCGEKNPFYGKKHTEENKKKMAAPHIGRKQSENEKRKRVESNKKIRLERYGKWAKPGTGEKISVVLSGRHLSDEHKQAIKENNKSSEQNVRDKISQSVKKLWENEDYRKKQVKAHTGKVRSDKSTKKWIESCALKPNKTEVFLDNLIQFARPADFIYSGDGKIFIAGKVPDWFNLNGKKQVIELLGNYWHSEKISGRTKEQEEDYLRSHYKKYGYDCLIIWEFELKNPEQVIEKVKYF